MRKTSEYPHDLLIALKQVQAFNTPTEIAEHFEEKGIKGDAGLTSNCAIAVYIYSSAPDDIFEVEVSDAGVRWQFIEEDDGASYHQISCTPAMGEFVRLFDDHHYPELERNQDVPIG